MPGLYPVPLPCSGPRPTVRANAVTPSGRHPARCRASAQAPAVDAVVTTSSTRTAGGRWSAFSAARWTSTSRGGRARNSPRTFARRDAPLRCAWRRPRESRRRAAVTRQPSSPARDAARRPAWLKPRRRRRADESGTGTRRGATAESGSSSATARAAGPMASPIRSASDVHPRYLSERTRSAAPPRIRYGARARGSSAGQSMHSPQASTPSAKRGPGAPHRRHRGGTAAGSRLQHARHAGARPGSTQLPHRVQDGGKSRPMRSRSHCSPLSSTPGTPDPVSTRPTGRCGVSHRRSSDPPSPRPAARAARRIALMGGSTSSQRRRESPAWRTSISSPSRAGISSASACRVQGVPFRP